MVVSHEGTALGYTLTLLIYQQRLSLKISHTADPWAVHQHWQCLDYVFREQFNNSKNPLNGPKPLGHVALLSAQSAPEPPSKGRGSDFNETVPNPLQALTKVVGYFKSAEAKEFLDAIVSNRGPYIEKKIHTLKKALLSFSG